jgi:hypothetical protein
MSSKLGGSNPLRRLAAQVLCAGFLVGSAACAPTLSSFTPAHVAKKGHVQAELGMDISAPGGGLRDVIDTGEQLADAASDQELSSEEQQRMLRAAWTYLLNPISVNAHLGVGVGVADDVEVDGRLVTGGWRLGGRYQFLHQAQSSVDLSAGLGIGRVTQNLDLLDFAGVVDFDDFSRWQFDLPLLVGKHGDWYRWWGGPRFMFTKYESAMAVGLPAIPGVFDGASYSASIEGTSSYLGAQFGAALGYKHVFLAAELTMAHFRAKGELETSGADWQGTKIDISGTVFYPGVALLGEF